MYPHYYFQLFPSFPKNNKVFVAMSFEEKFMPRWRNVIEPAIRNVLINETPLEPFRVDVRRVSDSILTEILEGISNSRIIFADITSIGRIDGKPLRNGNVMYEVGLAHAVRLPEEVIIFRSDKDDLLFDIANVRVNFYDPDGNPEVSKSIISNTILDALKEIDFKKNLAVKSTAQLLDFPSLMLLIEAGFSTYIDPPIIKTMGDALGKSQWLNAISRLLQLGALTTEYSKIQELLYSQSDRKTEKLLKYKITPFGKALLDHIFSNMDLYSRDVQNAIKEFLSKNENLNIESKK